jgi:glycosyltransferase involved in cell wall biosynthesis
MDILFVTRPIVPPWNEGSKNLTWQIARRLGRHRPHLMTVKGYASSELAAQVVWESVYTNTDVLLSAQQRVRLFLYLLGRKASADLYHFFFVPTPATSLLLAGLSRLHGKWTIQTVPSLYREKVSRNEAHRVFFADWIVAISDSTADHLRSLGLENVVRINAGVDVEHFSSCSASSSLRQQLGLLPESAVILFSGEYSRMGSIERLLGVMPKVLAQCPNSHFVFACRIKSQRDLLIEAELRQIVREVASSQRVHFLGEVSDFASVLKASDIFLLPVSNMLGKFDTPLTLLEAMATGLPIVSNDIAPVNEILTSGAGLVVPVGDDSAMIETLVSLVNDEQWRRRVGCAARKAAESRYDIQATVRAYERLYDTFS